MCETACWPHPLHACFSISHGTLGLRVQAFSLFNITGEDFALLNAAVLTGKTQYWHHFNALTNVNRRHHLYNVTVRYSTQILTITCSL